MAREGKVSLRFAHLGVHNVCLGPQAQAEQLRGERLRVVIYDQQDRIVRELREERALVRDGFVSFFDERCVPSEYSYYLVDIAADGTKTIAHDNPKQLTADFSAWVSFLGTWAGQHGVAQECAID